MKQVNIFYGPSFTLSAISNNIYLETKKDHLLHKLFYDIMNEMRSNLESIDSMKRMLNQMRDEWSSTHP